MNTNPIVIEQLPFSMTGDSTGFTSESNLGDGPDVYFSYANVDQVLVSIDTCGSLFDTEIALFEEFSSGTLLLRASNDDSSFCPGNSTLSQLTFELEANEDYVIVVVRKGGAVAKKHCRLKGEMRHCYDRTG